MKRRAWWLWGCVGVMGLALVVTFGGWWAIRRWPREIGVHLPPWFAFRLSTLGEQELIAAQSTFGDQPDVDGPPPTPAWEDACDAVLCDALRGPRSSQIAALRLMDGISRLYLTPATPARNALVFALIRSPDAELRRLARGCWDTEGTSASTQIRRIRPEDVDADRSPLSPDQWVAGRTAGIAWRAWGFVHSGHDHQRSRYKKYLREQLDLLLAAEHGTGRFADDERDHLIASLVVIRLAAMTNDEALKPVIQRISAGLGSDPTRLERLWREDTTAACLTALCSNALYGAGAKLADPAATALHAGFRTWRSELTRDEPPPWYSHGGVIPAAVNERWGAAMMVDFWNSDRDSAGTPQPPATLADPTGSTPFGRYLVRLATVVYADPRWKAAFDRRTDILNDTQIITADHQGLEGCWPARGAVSTMWETVFIANELHLRWPWSPTVATPASPSASP